MRSGVIGVHWQALRLTESSAPRWFYSIKIRALLDWAFLVTLILEGSENDTVITHLDVSFIDFTNTTLDLTAQEDLRANGKDLGGLPS